MPGEASPSKAPILVVAATPRELAAVADRAPARLLAGRPIALAEIGVGKAAAAAAMALALREHAVSWVVLSGCAGALPGSGLDLGDVVIADRSIFADEGVATDAGFLDLEAMDLALLRDAGGAPIYNVVPAALPAALVAAAAARRDAEPRLCIGPIATVSTCSGTDERARDVAARWQALAEGMEGAAAALACRAAGVPFIEVRGISNPAGRRDRAAWDIERAAAAAAGAVEWMIGFLE